MAVQWGKVARAQRLTFLEAFGNPTMSKTPASLATSPSAALSIRSMRDALCSLLLPQSCGSSTLRDLCEFDVQILNDKKGWAKDNGQLELMRRLGFKECEPPPKAHEEPIELMQAHRILHTRVPVGFTNLIEYTATVVAVLSTFLDPEYISQIEDKAKLFVSHRDEEREKGNALLKAGQFREALAAYASAFASCPLDARLPANMAEAALKCGDAAAARSYALVSLAVLEPPTSPRVFHERNAPGIGANADLASKIFTRLSRAWEVDCSRTCLRAAWAACRSSSNFGLASRYAALLMRAADPPITRAALPTVLMRTDLDAMERHVVGNTEARRVGHGIDAAQLRRPDGSAAQLGFFAAGEPRNVLLTIWNLIEEKLHSPAGIGTNDSGLRKLERDHKGYFAIKERLEANPVNAEVHLNDISPPTLARDILLLLIAGESSPQPVPFTSELCGRGSIPCNTSAAAASAATAGTAAASAATASALAACLTCFCFCFCFCFCCYC